jgi:hypothetical protein
MSYAIDFTSDARASWRELDVALQEEILDVLDRLADNPSLLRRSKASPEWAFDFTHDIAESRHYVFMTVRLNRTTSKLTVLKLGHSSRKI